MLHEIVAISFWIRADGGITSSEGALPKELNPLPSVLARLGPKDPDHIPGHSAPLPKGIVF
jgi:hypothetical protein